MITIKNEFLSEKDAALVYKTLTVGSNWSFSGRSSDLAEPTFWYCELFDSKDLLSIFINSITRQGFEVKNINAFYANGQSHGQCGQFHTDSKSPSDITLLYYVNYHWKPEWGGFTIFKNQKGEASDLIIPEFNKAVFFNSNISHAGLEPTRLFAGLRVTIALKFSTIS